MNRRGFVKGIIGLVSGGVGALLTGKAEAADHIPDTTKKVKRDPPGTWYVDGKKTDIWAGTRERLIEHWIARANPDTNASRNHRSSCNFCRIESGERGVFD